MKKIMILMLAAALLLSGCNATAAGSSEAAQEPSSQQEESISQVSEPLEEEPSEPAEAPFVEDDAFYKDVLIAYGGKLEDGILRTAAVSLFYEDSWAKAEDLPVGSFYSWRLCQLWNEDIPHEEMVEKYQSPLGPDNGWFFEREEYEALVQQYFDVSVEHLRSDPVYYNAELKGYTLQAGGGMGDRPEIELLEVEEEDDLRLLHIVLKYMDGDENRVLCIRMGAEGAYKFVSYTAENEDAAHEDAVAVADTAVPASQPSVPSVSQAPQTSQPAASAPATSGSNTANGTGVFAGYSVTVTNKTSLATTSGIGGNSLDYYYFYSASGESLGYITTKTYTAIDSKYLSGKESEEKQVWFANEFNKYRGLGSSDEPVSSGTIKAGLDTKAADEVVRLVNQARAKEGLHEYVVDSYLTELAQERAKELEVLFSHQRPDGSYVNGGNLNCLENIHSGSNAASDAMKAWMNSKGHKEAILSENCVSIGVGVYKDGTGRYHWVQLFEYGEN